MDTPSTGTGSRYLGMIPRPIPPRLQVLGFFMGAAIALGIVTILFIGGSGSLRSRIDALLLPHDLKGATFLYSTDNGPRLYHQEVGKYADLNLGTVLPPRAIARRATHYISIVQDPSTYAYEVREDATGVYRSATVKLQPAVAPDGAWIAFTELPAGDPHASTTEMGSPTIALVAKDGNGYRPLGLGFSPFFLSSTLLAWFSPEGLMEFDLASGSLKLVDATLRPAGPPNPPPAFSPDGTLVAWAHQNEPSVSVERFTATGGVTHVHTYTVFRSPYIALGNTMLYALVYGADGTQVWQYPLSNKGEAPATPVRGIPDFGHLITLLP